MATLSRYAGRENLRRISSTQFRRMVNQLQISLVQCAAVLYVDPRTVRAWALGERHVPGPAIAALELLIRYGPA